MASSKTGLLIIRAWVEEGSTEPLRAHIRLSGDIAHGIDRTLALSQRDEVSAVVAAWLSDILDGI